MIKDLSSPDTMDHPDSIALNQKEESISAKRVNLNSCVNKTVWFLSRPATLDQTCFQRRA